MTTTMKQRLRQHWEQFKAAKPGQRFQAEHKRRNQNRRHPVVRVLRMAFAAAITIAGLVLMPAPGPGTVVFVLGLSLLAHESLWIARGLDRFELRLRPVVLAAWHRWQLLPPWAKLLLILLAVLLATAAAGLFWLGWSG